MTWSLLHCVYCFNPWWHGCGPQNLRVQMATVGLGSLAWPIAGTMLAGLLLTHNCIYVQFFKYTLIYTKQTINHSYDTHFPLPNMPVEASHKHVLSCMSHAMHDHHMCRYFFCSANMWFFACFQSVRSCEEKHTQWFCETCFVFFPICLLNS